MAQLPSTEARVLVAATNEADRFLPEGPRSVTVAGREAVAWVNIQTSPEAKRGDIHLYFWDTGERRTLPQTARPGFLVPTDRPNVILVGQDKEVGTLDLLSGAWVSLARIPDDNPRTMINHGELVPGGKAIVFGTKDFQFKEPIAHLYLFTAEDRRLRTLISGQICSNGKVFARAADGSLLLYDIDTPKRNVVRYQLDVERGSLREEAVAVDLHSVEGFPDGMIDAGNHTGIIAFYNPHRAGTGHARRYQLQTGELLEEWTTPGSPRVTCPLLVRRDGGVKVVLTTAVEGMPAELRAGSPNAGDLFVADTTLREAPPVEVLRL